MKQKFGISAGDIFGDCTGQSPNLCQRTFYKVNELPKWSALFTFIPLIAKFFCPVPRVLSVLLLTLLLVPFSLCCTKHASVPLHLCECQTFYNVNFAGT